MIWFKKFFFYFIYRLLSSSWRVRLYIDPTTSQIIHSKEPLILAHWHGDEYSLIHLVKPFQLATMTSMSKDGEVVDFLIHRLGGATSRGSSTRGGARALLGLIRLLKSGRTTSIAVDGPRGPRHRVKPGVFELARLGQASIAPVGVYCHFAIRFESAWNKAYLPLPFARVQIVFGKILDPVRLSPDANAESNAALLTTEINNASQLAAKLFAGKNSEC